MSAESSSADLVKQALLQIRTLKARLAEAEQARAEPIAIVGAGLRLPGGICDLDQLGRSLAEGLDAIAEIPRERWDIAAYYDPDPNAPGRMITRRGAFLDGVDHFDAEFFGISPREAASMDPQQRIVLEVAWEALENAGIAPASLDGKAAGVFLGISNGDYGRALLNHIDDLDVYVSTGNAYSVAAGRLAYTLGLTGPSIAVDTACSSSLVALHLACQSLRLRECDLVLAGGVNLILKPEMNVIFSHGRMMAADGRCKTFDADADGYVRGEGCGMLALRRLSDARESGEPILGVVRGSAINQDGRSGGLTAPNGPAQAAVISAALRAGNVAPGEVSYVEAHGTGTPLGDPIEVGALAKVLCDRRTEPLAIGSIKTNIGHLEAAAGVAGVLKVVAAMRLRQIPPHLHFREGNPNIDWSQSIFVPTAPTAWRPDSGRRIAGVSSFGFAGCNAHVVIEEPPAAEIEGRAERRAAELLCLSARDAAALREVAGRMRAHLVASGDDALPDVAFTAAAGRSAFSHRLAVRAETAGSAVERLDGFLANGAADGVSSGRADGRPKVAFLFSGQGAQYAGMARELYAGSPVFRETLDRCGRVLSPMLGFDAVAAILDPAAEIDDVRIAQPATLAVQLALAATWRSFGVEPALVLGHSFGEYAAACIAGLIPFEEGLKLAAERGRLTAERALPGAMGAIFAPADAVAEAVASAEGEVVVAAHNGPEHVVVSGEREGVAALLSSFEARGHRVKPLRVVHPAHSPLLDPVVEPFRAVLSRVCFGGLATLFVSTVTGDVVDAARLGEADYWVDHMRQPVRFADGVRAAATQGVTHWLEIGPHPVLLPMVSEILGAEPTTLLPSLQRERSDWAVFSDSVGRLFCAGAEIDWDAFHRGRGCRRTALPTYPFQRRRHWSASLERPTVRGASPAWPALCQALDRQAEQGPLDLNISSYPAKWALLSRLTRAHAMRTLSESGLFASAGESHTAADVMAKAEIGPSYAKIVDRWLNGLAADGLLVLEADRYIAPAPLPEPDLDKLWREAESLFADNQPLLAYVAHCGDLVGCVLRGQASPLETLFPNGSAELARGLYERSATMRYVNALAAAAVRSLTETRAGAAVEVMEVGGGTGGTTTAILDALAPGARYRFTDVSGAFFDEARSRLDASRAVSFAVFDFDKDLEPQGYAPGGVDVIVSANAVHASTDLRAALARLRSLLAPGGCLVLVESTTHFDWFDMTTGLIEGWQHFADDLRTDQPLLDAQTWTAALADAGFAEARAWPPAGAPAEALGQHVIVARVAGELSIRSRTESEPEPTGDLRPSGGGAPSSLAERVRDAIPAERLDLLRDHVRGEVMRVLDLPRGAEPDRNARLLDLGLDSLMAVQLRGLLARSLGEGATLPASLVFDYPTIEAIARHLLGLISTDPVAPPASPGARDVAAASAAVPTDEEIEAILMERMPHV